MKFTRSSVLPEIIIIEPDVFKDGRGHFFETYQAQRYLDHGIPAGLVQDNMSYSVQGVLRGLLHSGLYVKQGFKVGDLDPRNDPGYCRMVSDKSLAIGGGVLEAILTFKFERQRQEG